MPVPRRLALSSALPSAFLHALGRSLLPSACALCGQRSATVVCAGCRSDAITPRPRCRSCANPLAGAALATCGACLAAPPAFDATIAAADYAPPFDQLLLQLKFAACLPLAPWCAQILRDAILQHDVAHALPCLLLPVPLSRQRLQQRGFNQALEVARHLSRLLGVPCDAGLLLRTRDTLPQSALAPAQRAANVRAAFALAPAHRPLAGLHIGVVDDVMTSGRTVDALAHVLKRAGAERVSNYVVARTPPA